MDYKSVSFTGHGGHTIFYSDWGEEDAPPLICVHGLTGNGFDFDFLAPHLLADGYRLICVDLPGRGRSDFLGNSLSYNYAQYRLDLLALLEHLGLNAPRAVDWLGVSLGGLLGIWIAGEKNSPIRRLILNDVGPTVPKQALDFIYQVIAQTYEFDDVNALEERMRATRGLSWGPMTDVQWMHMAQHNYRDLDNGKVSYAYDPGIADVFKNAPIGDVDLWRSWDALSSPVLLLRGGQSLILPEGLVKEMQQRGPAFDLHVFEDCGHVPSLWAENQIAVIRDWLYKSKP